MRESYNFAPGYYGLVYRADVPDYGLRDNEEFRNDVEGTHDEDLNSVTNEEDAPRPQSTPKKTTKKGTPKSSPQKTTTEHGDGQIHFQLKAMKWGLIPFWTKRSPDYGSMMRTINCRDDSLIENRGMWNTMKQRKRCVVVCQGFYEWLKKGPGGKEKIPYFIKRKDGKLMCFAGLWDCVKYEDAEEKLYTYTIITTDSNQQLRFLHDRMPVILEAGSEAMQTWLDPRRTTWSKELQSLLKPFEGELECYPVSKDVGKVGNNSAEFLVPVDSKENKKNIANFFANAKKGPVKSDAHPKATREPVKKEEEVKVEHDEGEHRQTKDHDGSEDNAPLPVPKEDLSSQAGRKRPRTPDDTDKGSSKASKKEAADSKSSKTPTSSRKTRNATSNGTQLKGSTPKKASDGSQRITNFFGK